MKKWRYKISVVSAGVFLLLFAQVQRVFSQCAMCTLNAENSVQNGNTQGMGLNDGVLFLLACPYVVVLVVGIIWYRKYRQKNHTQIRAKHDSIHLN